MKCGAAQPPFKTGPTTKPRIARIFTEAAFSVRFREIRGSAIRGPSVFNSVDLEGRQRRAVPSS
jgi:hypothetical protein